MAKKKYDVFISYAEPDRLIAESLKGVLTDVGLTSFFAKTHVPTDMPTRHQDGIIKKGIEPSRCYIMICTPNSINRSWVLFEAGAAKAFGLRCYRARIERTTNADIGTMPNPDDQHNYELFKKTDVVRLLKSIAKDARKQAKQPVINRITDYVTNEEHNNLNSLTTLASVRWAFIAGNTTLKNKKLTPARKTQMTTFVKELTITLLNYGFSITACPQVEAVGKKAILAADGFITDQKQDSSSSSPNVDYAIGGIHPIDRNLRKLKISPSRKSKFHEHIMGFRESYLNNQEWLVLLGGSTGTQEEYMAVQRLNCEGRAQIKTFAIPCFGGVAKQIFDELKKNGPADYLLPCIKCNPSGKKCTRIDDIVKSMKKT